MKRIIFTALISLSCILPSANAQDISIRFSPSLDKIFAEDYGVREKEILREKLLSSIEKSLLEKDLESASVDLEILSIKPNHPTRHQLSKTPGLDRLRSVTLGGAKIHGRIYDADGNLIRELESHFFANTLKEAYTGGTWHHANRAFKRFARKLGNFHS